MEKHIVIDKDRNIIVPDELKRIAVQYDHNVETVTFDCPRYWDGNDLSKMTIYVNYSNKMNQTPGAHPVTNVCIDSEDEDLLHFDWVISRNVTEKKGSLIIMVCAKLVDDEDRELQHWNSEINAEMYISEALRAGAETIVEAYPDAITGMYTRISKNEKEISSLDGRVSKLEETGPYIDPVFANNSWELIKWVCQNDDPSKYWKVGDYKEIEIGTSQHSYAFDTTNVLNSNGVEVETPVYGGDDGFTYEGDAPVTAHIYDEEGFLSLVGNQAGEYKVLLLKSNGDYGYDPGNRVYVIEGISDPFVDKIDLYGNADDVFSYEGDNYIIVTITEDIVSNTYPLQIIGFNHDKVTNPYEYGKAKAGMTLQLGCSRSQYGDTKASLYSGTIEGLMSSNGKYFKSPNKVLSDFTDGATNWVDGGFRLALQSLFDGTEVAPYMVEVTKYTVQYYTADNYWCSVLHSNDKVFLPSEWELYGLTVHAPTKEGEQYEFYKDGYSKFMWHKDLLDGTTSVANLWLRSAQGSSVNVNSADKASTCAVYYKVHTLHPQTSVNYTPSSAASENRAGFIAPCICL
jgi:hypothetical protein